MAVDRPQLARCSWLLCCAPNHGKTEQPWAEPSLPSSVLWHCHNAILVGTCLPTAL